MSAPSPDRIAADRNLLVGILAFQVDFISREQLIAAMQTWVFNKHLPLGEILVRQKALTHDRLALLDALVQEHLRQHDNDQMKSLAALSSLGSARRDLEALSDADVQASLAHVATARKDDADPYATNPPVQVGSSTSAGARFHILRPHAHGGLGQVYVARDQELGREVALKEIKGEYAGHVGYRSRFLLEAEVTGGLEHPGIVPVYGLGTYADGRPFYAMRFIRGDSLRKAIERFHRPDRSGDQDPAGREAELRQLLRRFHDVCNALEYAHSRGVLHRDLKPANIMLGRYGETLVVDWGLAKPLGRAHTAPPAAGLPEAPLLPASGAVADATQMGSAVGTPAFMSPEQAEGRLDLVSPASDVYSLGATLYCLLTGSPPLAGNDLGDVLERARRGAFPRPRQLRPELHPALEAICLKAMAPRPADRYGSAAELGQEVERWLDDLPVQAWAEPGLPARSAGCGATRKQSRRQRRRFSSAWPRCRGPRSCFRR